MKDWCVGLSSWIIQDGNYGEFSCQQQAEFALEFYPQEWKTVLPGKKQAQLLAGSTYKLTAEVIHVSSRAWVIDFGVPAYQQTEPPKNVHKGTWLEAVVYLGIDPFFYFEELAHVEGMPPLIYSWDITKIGIETAPFIETTDARGTRVMVRDEAKSAFREIDKTDAWTDDNGHAEYVLHCSLVHRPPRQIRGS